MYILPWCIIHIAALIKVGIRVRSPWHRWPTGTDLTPKAILSSSILLISHLSPTPPWCIAGCDSGYTIFVFATNLRTGRCWETEIFTRPPSNGVGGAGYRDSSWLLRWHNECDLPLPNGALTITPSSHSLLGKSSRILQRKMELCRGGTRMVS